MRDGSEAQRVIPLAEQTEPMTIGRGPSCSLCLSWDPEVSRLHARLERLGDEWTIDDDGMSANGTFVNGERLTGRHRLRDRDVMRFGRVAVAFRSPSGTAISTVIGTRPARPDLSDAQRRVLVALCKPYLQGGTYAVPATNREIAEELFLTVEAVKTHMRTLFQRFAIEDLPQNAKRTKLVELALETATVTPRDLER